MWARFNRLSLSQSIVLTTVLLVALSIAFGLSLIGAVLIAIGSAVGVIIGRRRAR